MKSSNLFFPVERLFSSSVETPISNLAARCGTPSKLQTLSSFNKHISRLVNETRHYKIVSL